MQHRNVLYRYKMFYPADFDMMCALKAGCMTHNSYMHVPHVWVFIHCVWLRQTGNSLHWLWHWRQGRAAISTVCRRQTKSHLHFVVPHNTTKGGSMNWRQFHPSVMHSISDGRRRLDFDEVSQNDACHCSVPAFLKLYWLALEGHFNICLLVTDWPKGCHLWETGYLILGRPHNVCFSEELSFSRSALPKLNPGTMAFFFIFFFKGRSFFFHLAAIPFSQSQLEKGHQKLSTVNVF